MRGNKRERDLCQLGEGILIRNVKAGIAQVQLKENAEWDSTVGRVPIGCI
jgi:hypothetical protein